MPVLVERLRATEGRRRELIALLERDAARVTRASWREIERRMRKSLADWRLVAHRRRRDARQAFRQLLTKPIRFTPFVRARLSCDSVRGPVGLAAVFSGVVTKVASPTGFEPVFWP